MNFAQEERNSKMEKQKNVDEALVGLMALLSYKLYRDKEKGKKQIYGVQ